MADPGVVKDDATLTIDLPAFTVPVAKFTKTKDDDSSFQKIYMDKYRNISKKAILGHEKKAVDELQWQKMDSVRF